MNNVKKGAINLVALGIFVFITVLIPATVKLVQQNQENRSKAAQECHNENKQVCIEYQEECHDEQYSCQTCGAYEQICEEKTRRCVVDMDENGNNKVWGDCSYQDCHDGACSFWENGSCTRNKCNTTNNCLNWETQSQQVCVDIPAPPPPPDQCQECYDKGEDCVNGNCVPKAPPPATAPVTPQPNCNGEEMEKCICGCQPTVSGGICNQVYAGNSCTPLENCASFDCDSPGFSCTQDGGTCTGVKGQCGCVYSGCLENNKPICNKEPSCINNSWSCTCNPSCDGKACGQSDGCGGFCYSACSTVPKIVSKEKLPTDCSGECEGSRDSSWTCDYNLFSGCTWRQGSDNTNLKCLGGGNCDRCGYNNEGWGWWGNSTEEANACQSWCAGHPSDPNCQRAVGGVKSAFVQCGDTNNDCRNDSADYNSGCVNGVRLVKTGCSNGCFANVSYYRCGENQTVSTTKVALDNVINYYTNQGCTGLINNKEKYLACLVSEKERIGKYLNEQRRIAENICLNKIPYEDSQAYGNCVNDMFGSIFVFDLSGPVRYFLDSKTGKLVMSPEYFKEVNCKPGSSNYLVGPDGYYSCQTGEKIRTDSVTETACRGSDGKYINYEDCQKTLTKAQTACGNQDATNDCLFSEIAKQKYEVSAETQRLETETAKLEKFCGDDGIKSDWCLTYYDQKIQEGYSIDLTAKSAVLDTKVVRENCPPGKDYISFKNDVNVYNCLTGRALDPVLKERYFANLTIDAICSQATGIQQTPDGYINCDTKTEATPDQLQKYAVLYCKDPNNKCTSDQIVNSTKIDFVSKARFPTTSMCDGNSVRTIYNDGSSIAQSCGEGTGCTGSSCIEISLAKAAQNDCGLNGPAINPNDGCLLKYKRQDNEFRLNEFVGEIANGVGFANQQELILVLKGMGLTAEDLTGDAYKRFLETGISKSGYNLARSSDGFSIIARETGSPDDRKVLYQNVFSPRGDKRTAPGALTDYAKLQQAKLNGTTANLLVEEKGDATQVYSDWLSQNPIVKQAFAMAIKTLAPGYNPVLMGVEVPTLSNYKAIAVSDMTADGKPFEVISIPEYGKKLMDEVALDFDKDWSERINGIGRAGWAGLNTLGKAVGFYKGADVWPPENSEPVRWSFLGAVDIMRGIPTFVAQKFISGTYRVGTEIGLEIRSGGNAETKKQLMAADPGLRFDQEMAYRGAYYQTTVYVPELEKTLTMAQLEQYPELYPKYYSPVKVQAKADELFGTTAALYKGMEENFVFVTSFVGMGKSTLAPVRAYESLAPRISQAIRTPFGKVGEFLLPGIKAGQAVPSGLQAALAVSKLPAPVNFALDYAGNALARGAHAIPLAGIIGVSQIPQGFITANVTCNQLKTTYGYDCSQSELVKNSALPEEVKKAYADAEEITSPGAILSSGLSLAAEWIKFPMFFGPIADLPTKTFTSFSARSREAAVEKGPWTDLKTTKENYNTVAEKVRATVEKAKFDAGTRERAEQFGDTVLRRELAKIYGREPTLAEMTNWKLALSVPVIVQPINNQLALPAPEKAIPVEIPISVRLSEFARTREFGGGALPAIIADIPKAVGDGIKALQNLSPENKVSRVVDSMEKMFKADGQPNELNCRGGSCGVGAASSVYFAETLGGKGKEYQVFKVQEQLRGVKINDSFQHAFAIIEFDGKKFLVDRTFTQFMDKATGKIMVKQGEEMGGNIVTDNITNELAQQLFKNGYVELTDANLGEYLRITAKAGKGTSSQKVTVEMIDKVKPLADDYSPQEKIRFFKPYSPNTSSKTSQGPVLAGQANVEFTLDLATLGTWRIVRAGYNSLPQSVRANIETRVNSFADRFRGETSKKVSGEIVPIGTQKLELQKLKDIFPNMSQDISEAEYAQIQPVFGKAIIEIVPEIKADLERGIGVDTVYQRALISVKTKMLQNGLDAVLIDKIDLHLNYTVSDIVEVSLNNLLGSLPEIKPRQAIIDSNQYDGKVSKIEINPINLRRIDVGSSEGSSANVFITKEKIKGEEVVLAVKIFKGNLDRRTKEYFDREISMVQLVDRLGIGPKFYGRVDLGDGRSAYATEYIDGFFLELAGKMGYVTSQTLEDLINVKKVLAESGYFPYGDFQFMVTKKGRAIVMDPASITKLSELSPDEKIFEEQHFQELLKDVEEKISDGRRFPSETGQISLKLPTDILKAAGDGVKALQNMSPQTNSGQNSNIIGELQSTFPVQNTQGIDFDRLANRWKHPDAGVIATEVQARNLILAVKDTVSGSNKQSEQSLVGSQGQWQHIDEQSQKTFEELRGNRYSTIGNMLLAKHLPQIRDQVLEVFNYGNTILVPPSSIYDLTLPEITYLVGQQTIIDTLLIRKITGTDLKTIRQMNMYEFEEAVDSVYRQGRDDANKLWDNNRQIAYSNGLQLPYSFVQPPITVSNETMSQNTGSMNTTGIAFPEGLTMMNVSHLTQQQAREYLKEVTAHEDGHLKQGATVINVTNNRGQNVFLSIRKSPIGFLVEGVEGDAPISLFPNQTSSYHGVTLSNAGTGNVIINGREMVIPNKFFTREYWEITDQWWRVLKPQNMQAAFPAIYNGGAKEFQKALNDLAKQIYVAEKDNHALNIYSLDDAKKLVERTAALSANFGEMDSLPGIFLDTGRTQPFIGIRSLYDAYMRQTWQEKFFSRFDSRSPFDKRFSKYSDWAYARGAVRTVSDLTPLPAIIADIPKAAGEAVGNLQTKVYDVLYNPALITALNSPVVASVFPTSGLLNILPHLQGIFAGTTTPTFDWKRLVDSKPLTSANGPNAISDVSEAFDSKTKEPIIIKTSRISPFSTYDHLKTEAEVTRRLQKYKGFPTLLTEQDYISPEDPFRAKRYRIAVSKLEGIRGDQLSGGIPWETRLAILYSYLDRIRVAWDEGIVINDHKTDNYFWNGTKGGVLIFDLNGAILLSDKTRNEDLKKDDLYNFIGNVLIPNFGGRPIFKTTDLSKALESELPLATGNIKVWIYSKLIPGLGGKVSSDEMLSSLRMATLADIKANGGVEASLIQIINSNPDKIQPKNNYGGALSMSLIPGLTPKMTQDIWNWAKNLFNRQTPAPAAPAPQTVLDNGIVAPEVAAVKQMADHLKFPLENLSPEQFVAKITSDRPWYSSNSKELAGKVSPEGSPVYGLYLSADAGYAQEYALKNNRTPSVFAFDISKAKLKIADFNYGITIDGKKRQEILAAGYDGVIFEGMGGPEVALLRDVAVSKGEVLPIPPGIQYLIDNHKPIDKVAVEKYQIQLPAGYVLQGSSYVFTGSSALSGGAPPPETRVDLSPKTFQWQSPEQLFRDWGDRMLGLTAGIAPFGIPDPEINQARQTLKEFREKVPGNYIVVYSWSFSKNLSGIAKDGLLVLKNRMEEKRPDVQRIFSEAAVSSGRQGLPDRTKVVYALPSKDGGWLSGKSLVDEVLLDAAVDPATVWVADATYYDWALNAGNDKRALENAKTYWQTAVKFDNYRPGMFKKPEILISSDVPAEFVRLSTSVSSMDDLNLVFLPFLNVKLFDAVSNATFYKWWPEARTRGLAPVFGDWVRGVFTRQTPAPAAPVPEANPVGNGIAAHNTTTPPEASRGKQTNFQNVIDQNVSYLLLANADNPGQGKTEVLSYLEAVKSGRDTSTWDQKIIAVRETHMRKFNEYKQRALNTQKQDLITKGLDNQPTENIDDLVLIHATDYLPTEIANGPAIQPTFKGSGFNPDLQAQTIHFSVNHPVDPTAAVGGGSSWQGKRLIILVPFKEAVSLNSQPFAFLPQDTWFALGVYEDFKLPPGTVVIVNKNDPLVPVLEKGQGLNVIQVDNSPYEATGKVLADLGYRSIPKEQFRNPERFATELGSYFGYHLGSLGADPSESYTRAGGLLTNGIDTMVENNVNYLNDKRNTDLAERLNSLILLASDGYFVSPGFGGVIINLNSEPAVNDLTMQWIRDAKNPGDRRFETKQQLEVLAKDLTVTFPIWSEGYSARRLKRISDGLEIIPPQLLESFPLINGDKLGIPAPPSGQTGPSSAEASGGKPPNIGGRILGILKGFNIAGWGSLFLYGAYCNQEVNVDNPICSGFIRFRYIIEKGKNNDVLGVINIPNKPCNTEDDINLDLENNYVEMCRSGHWLVVFDNVFGEPFGDLPDGRRCNEEGLLGYDHKSKCSWFCSNGYWGKGDPSCDMGKMADSVCAPSDKKCSQDGNDYVCNLKNKWISRQGECSKGPFKFIMTTSSKNYENFSEEVDKILVQRKKLGLSSTPPEFNSYDPFKAREDWVKDRNFTDELPPSMREIGDGTNTLLKVILGANYSKMIRGVKIGGGTAYDSSDGKILIPQFYHPSKKDFTMLMLHEGIGHGSDPALFFSPENGFKYPPDIFYQLETAKWQMLSQSWLVPGEYLNHPQDWAHKNIWATNGRTVAEKYYFDKTGFPRLTGADKLQELINLTARDLGISQDKIIFTKKFNYTLGQKVQSSLTEGNDYFFQQSYEENVASSLVEIYAEMIKWSLVPKEIFAINDPGRQAAFRTQNNPIIQDAVKKWLEAIKGEPVNLDDVRKNIYEYYSFLPDVLSPLSQTAIQTQTAIAQPARTPTMTADQLAYQKAQINQSQFLSTGQIPQTDSSALNNYLGLYLEVYKKYPQAGAENIDADVSFEAFDPPTLHAWETEKITSSMRNSRLQDLFIKMAQGRSLSTSETGELNKDSETLKFYLDKLPSQPKGDRAIMVEDKNINCMPNYDCPKTP